ncbi:hypothetical protein V1477_005610 [Vespula maculifrons]|uniref:CBS domain-containing protein n=1 Tax=Vespula maculifrons TaxID=7453 RepID=A0ABD2CQ76_VESMC
MDLFCEASFLEFLFRRAYKRYTVVPMADIQKSKTIGRVNAIIHYSSVLHITEVRNTVPDISVEEIKDIVEMKENKASEREHL